MEKKQRILKGNIENTSILRKFTVLFLIMSVIPMTVLFYFYIQVKNYGRISLSEAEMSVTLIFVALGILTGYISMRSVLLKLVYVTKQSAKSIEGVLSSSNLENLEEEKNEIDVLSQAFKVVTSRLEENIKSLEIAKKTLRAVMSRVGQGLASSDNIDSFLELIIETITSALNGDIGALLVFDTEENCFSLKSVYGQDYDGLNPIKIKSAPGNSLFGVMEHKKPKILSQLTPDLNELEKKGYFSTPVICAPLISHDRCYGIVAISGGGVEDKFGDDEMSILLSLASQTAVAIANSHLSKNIETTYFETISALALAVDAKDRYSRGHLDRVAHYCMMMAEDMNLSKEEQRTLQDAARLHDLGKIGIPDSLLKKDGPLSDDEWVLMKKHPEMGESIIKPIKSLNHLCDIVRHHHEKLDGSGYPDGLKGDEISLLTRITTIADIYDALTTDRSYRPKMAPQEAVNTLKEMGGKLDQNIVESFIKNLKL